LDLEPSGLHLETRGVHLEPHWLHLEPQGLYLEPQGLHPEPQWLHLVPHSSPGLPVSKFQTLNWSTNGAERLLLEPQGLHLEPQGLHLEPQGLHLEPQAWISFFAGQVLKRFAKSWPGAQLQKRSFMDHTMKI